MVRTGPFFFHEPVLEAKRTTKMSGSRFSQSDRTVRSGFQNHATADALTKTLCLAASISIKDRGREVKHKDAKEGTKRNKERKTYDDGSIRSTYKL